MSAESENRPKIRFYRGITGPLGKGGIFRGHSEKELKRGGIFLSNDSEEQRQGSREVWYYSEGEYEPDRAPGLLVFTTFNEAQDWLKGKRFSPGLPAVASIEFLVGYFRRKLPGVRLFRHFPNPAFIDYEISPQEIIEKVTAGNLETGEYYLQGSKSTQVPDTMRRGRERILIPNKFTKAGYIDFRAGFREI